MKFQVKEPLGVPEGTYPVEFASAEPYLENVEKYGEGVLLKWRVLSGQHVDAFATRIVSANLSAKSHLGKFVVAMLGRPIAPGETIDLSELAGCKGLVVVEKHGEGARVATFVRNA